MGKYTKLGRKATKKVWEDPEGNARRVVDAMVFVFSTCTDDLVREYGDGLEKADINRMQKLLATWYKHIPSISRKFREAYARVVAPAPR